MVGYGVNPRIGVLIYNLMHHKAMAVLFIVGGAHFANSDDK
jgi:hypothetical protein